MHRTQYVKAFVKLNQQRMSVDPALQLPARMEDCVVKLTTPSKISQDALKLFSRSVAKFTWSDGALALGASLALLLCSRCVFEPQQA